MLGILRNGEGLAIQALKDFGVDLVEFKDSIDNNILKQQEDAYPNSEIVLSKSTEKILKMSILEARLTKSQETDSEHLLLAILKDHDNIAAMLLEEYHMDYNGAFTYIKSMSDLLDKNSKQSPRMGADFTDDDDEDDEPVNNNAGGELALNNLDRPQIRLYSTILVST